MASLAVQPSSALAAVTGGSNRSASPAHHAAALPVPAAVAAPAPGAPAAVPGGLTPVPSGPLTYREWFDQQPGNLAKARELKAASLTRCNQQGLGKEQAMVWDEHAGVDPTDDKRRVTKRDVLLKQIEFAQARVDHWKMVEANPAWNKLGAHIKPLVLAGKNLKEFQKQLDKLDGVKHPRVGSSSGGSNQFGKGERGPVRNDATKAGQLARVPKGVTLPPGVERVYAEPCGTVIYQLKVGDLYIASKSAIMAKDQLLARRAGGGSGRGRGGGGGEGGDDEDEEADEQQEVQVDIDTDAILANARLTTYDKTKLRRALLRIVKLTPQERVAVLGEDLAGLVAASTGSDSDGDNSDGDGSDDEEEDEQEEGAAAAAFQPAARGGVRKATEAAPKPAPSAATAAATAAATVTPAANRRNIQLVSLASDSEGEDEEEPAAPAPAAQTVQPFIETVDLVSDSDDEHGEIKEEAAPAAPAAAAVATQPVEVVDLVSDDEEDASDGAAAEMAVALPETQPPAAMEEEEAAEAATMPHATLAVDATPLADAEDEAADDEEMEEAESEDEPDAKEEEEEEEAAAKPAARGGKRKAPASKPKAAPKPKAQSTRATRGSGAAKGKTAAPKRTRR